VIILLMTGIDLLISSPIALSKAAKVQRKCQLTKKSVRTEKMTGSCDVCGEEAFDG